MELVTLIRELININATKGNLLVLLDTAYEEHELGELVVEDNTLYLVAKDFTEIDEEELEKEFE